MIIMQGMNELLPRAVAGRLTALQAITKMKEDKEDFIKFSDAFREDICA